MKKISLFSVVMVIIVLAVVIVAIIFPIRKSFLAKNDSLISSSLSSLVIEIDDYYKQKATLPTTLKELESTDTNARKIIDGNLVEYKVVDNNSITDVDSYIFSENEKTAFYELCVIYKYEKKSRSDYPNYDDPDSYQKFINTNSHPAGKVCYKLQTSKYI